MGVLDHEGCEFDQQYIFELIDLILETFLGELVGVYVMLQDLVPVELRQVAAKTH